jgi:hypothetical protein
MKEFWYREWNRNGASLRRISFSGRIAMGLLSRDLKKSLGLYYFTYNFFIKQWLMPVHKADL